MINAPFLLCRWMVLPLLIVIPRLKLLTTILGLLYLQVKTHVEGAPFPDMSPIIISVEDVHHQLSNLQTNKASSPDKIPAYFLKRKASSIAPVLFLILQ